ncbi:hypothetical protein BKA67DRAFT_553518 [Truncatella angustata]|uniref:Secreted protein n=1 Tax=Truncatella angustata TaxID=152316 RepID=A0A9P8UR91_9PEZI|nr:uncharacterized protein BKA67DRAFT_553518 [Truncatella angustata]KAH6656893.1 hypothetical protein BKA67DRAFT_553518 [Truncatella angustata]
MSHIRRLLACFLCLFSYQINNDHTCPLHSQQNCCGTTFADFIFSGMCWKDHSACNRAAVVTIHSRACSRHSSD